MPIETPTDRLIPFFKFRLSSMRDSSHRYGPCEVCRTFAPEIWHLARWHYVDVQDGSTRHQGWAYDGDRFGHETCLRSLQRPVRPPTRLTPPRTLTCCCCSNPTLGRQWSNRDTGYGLCERCALSLADSLNPADMQSYYGHRGIHYDLGYPDRLDPSRTTPDSE